MFTFIAIIVALLAGGWAGIAFDAFMWDAIHGGAERFSYYLAMPWHTTVKNVWSAITE